MTDGMHLASRGPHFSGWSLRRLLTRLLLMVLSISSALLANYYCKNDECLIYDPPLPYLYSYQDDHPLTGATSGTISAAATSYQAEVERGASESARIAAAAYGAEIAALYFNRLGISALRHGRYSDGVEAFSKAIAAEQDSHKTGPELVRQLYHFGGFYNQTAILEWDDTIPTGVSIPVEAFRCPIKSVEAPTLMFKPSIRMAGYKHNYALALNQCQKPLLQLPHPFEIKLPLTPFKSWRAVRPT